VVNSGTQITLTVSQGPAIITQTATVPNVVGMTVSSARAAIGNANLICGPVVYQHSGSPVDQILTQSVTSGSTVPLWTTINLTVSSG
jgi:beta-lactam-binding protein with PASTA domain